MPRVREHPKFKILRYAVHSAAAAAVTVVCCPVRVLSFYRCRRRYIVLCAKLREHCGVLGLHTRLFLT